MFDFWNEDLDPEQEDALIEKAAQEIHRRNLHAPAILALEMHKPLGYVASQATVVFSPFLVPFVGFDNVNNYSQLFSKRENIEKLIDRVEAMRHQPDHAKEA